MWVCHKLIFLSQYASPPCGAEKPLSKEKIGERFLSNRFFLYVSGWFFLTGPPDFQYQNEKTCSANEELFYIENFVKN